MSPLALQARLAKQILATVGTQVSFDEYRSPIGDPGLFGSDSVAWTVHRDLPAMLVGGISALMLQTLHPLAMAGIANHSNYREDPLGRLQRTARFIAGTTFGPAPLVDKLVSRVTTVHSQVEGNAPDGRFYSAREPDLLTWVHTSEVASFLHSFLRLGPETLGPEEIDRYFREVARIAYRLGAKEVPESMSEVTEYFDQVQDQLAVTAEAKEAVQFLRTPLSPHRVERLAHHVVVSEAIAQLPDFARKLLELNARPTLRRDHAHTDARAFAALVHWAIGPSKIAALADERAGGVP